MLLQFRVANWESIRDEQELSLVAADEHDDLAVRDIPGTELKALPVVGVFGANASGKSKLMRAMAYARDAVRYSHNRWNPRGGTGRVPFALDEAAVARPSEFAFDFVLDGVRHEYGFAVDDRAVASEWLYSWPRGRMRVLFERRGPQEIELGPACAEASATGPDGVGIGAGQQSLRVGRRGREPPAAHPCLRLGRPDDDGVR